MTTAQKNRLIDERAHALAYIFLTGREDQSPRIVNELAGLDYVVTLKSMGKPGLREFGVGLKASWAEATAERANAIFRPALERMLRSGPYPFPVVLFFYTMQDDAAWFTWAIEPATTPPGDGKLIAHSNAQCRPLNDAARDEINARVHAYYDAIYAQALRASHEAQAS